MKTKLFSVLMLVATLGFVACEDPTKGNDGDATLKGLTLNPHSLELAIDESSRLEITFDPAEAVPEVAWTTSDATIATVDVKGVVTAKAAGQAYIKATVGDIADSCLVTVKSQQEAITYTGAVIWSIDTTAFANADGTLPVEPITTSDGSETFNCYKALAQLYVMSEGFFVNESGYLDGTAQGSWISVQTPIWYGTAYLNPTYGGGVQFSLGEYLVASTWENDLLPAHGAYSGSVNEEYYLEYADLFVQYYNAAMLAETEDDYNANLSTAYTALQYAGLCVENTIVEEFEYHTTAEGYGQDGYYSSYVPAGIITDAYFSLNGDGINNFMMGVDFLEATYIPIDNQNYYWGLNLEQDTTNGTFSWVDQKIHYGEPITYTFGEVPAPESAPAMIATPANVFKEKFPMQAMKIENQLNLNRTKYTFLK